MTKYIATVYRVNPKGGRVVHKTLDITATSRGEAKRGMSYTRAATFSGLSW